MGSLELESKWRRPTAIVHLQKGWASIAGRPSSGFHPAKCAQPAAFGKPEREPTPKASATTWSTWDSAVRAYQRAVTRIAITTTTAKSTHDQLCLLPPAEPAQPALTESAQGGRTGSSTGRAAGRRPRPCEVAYRRPSLNPFLSPCESDDPHSGPRGGPPCEPGTTSRPFNKAISGPFPGRLQLGAHPLPKGSKLNMESSLGEVVGAHARIRTGDLFLTKILLCRDGWLRAVSNSTGPFPVTKPVC
jgi:hypothetical protein